LVSGSERFIDRIMGTVGPTHRIIALVEISLRGATLRGLRKSRASAKKLLKRHGMQHVSFLDLKNDGATDACHVLVFGRDLGSDVLPTASKGLPLSLCHFLDGVPRVLSQRHQECLARLCRWSTTRHGRCCGTWTRCWGRGSFPAPTHILWCTPLPISFQDSGFDIH